MCALPCIVCKKPLPNMPGVVDNHPMHGLEFTTDGHYGSTVFDPMDRTFLVINICDACIADAAIAGLVRQGEPAGFAGRALTPWPKAA